jgi:N-acetylneuraminate lyase
LLLARSINTSAIPALAKAAAAYGVTVVWTCGGMGEFYSLTLAERKAINAAWVAAAKTYGLYVIVHVGTTVQADAIDMAAHAAAIGADAIASVPPYYEQPGSIDQLIAFFQPIVLAANGLPFY